MPSSPVPFPASLGRFFHPPMRLRTSRMILMATFHLNRWEDSSAQAPAKKEGWIEHPTWSIKIRTILLLLLLLLLLLYLLSSWLFGGPCHIWIVTHQASWKTCCFAWILFVHFHKAIQVNTTIDYKYHNYPLKFSIDTQISIGHICSKSSFLASQISGVVSPRFHRSLVQESNQLI